MYAHAAENRRDGLLAPDGGQFRCGALPCHFGAILLLMCLFDVAPGSGDTLRFHKGRRFGLKFGRRAVKTPRRQQRSDGVPLLGLLVKSELV